MHRAKADNKFDLANYLVIGRARLNSLLSVQEEFVDSNEFSKLMKFSDNRPPTALFTNT